MLNFSAWYAPPRHGLHTDRLSTALVSFIALCALLKTYVYHVPLGDQNYNAQFYKSVHKVRPYNPHTKVLLKVLLKTIGVFLLVVFRPIRRNSIFLPFLPEYSNLVSPPSFSSSVNNTDQQNQEFVSLPTTTQVCCMILTSYPTGHVFWPITRPYIESN